MSKRIFRQPGYCRQIQSCRGRWVKGEGEPIRVTAVFPTNIYMGTASGLSRPGSITGESVFPPGCQFLILKTPISLRSSVHQGKVPLVTGSPRTAVQDGEEKNDRRTQAAWGAGLSRIHIGLETGYNPLLEFMKKGVTAAEHIEGGGISSPQEFPSANTSCPASARSLRENMPWRRRMSSTGSIPISSG